MQQQLTISTKLRPIFSLVLILITGSQGAVIAPVACFESDGRITIESSCNQNVCTNVASKGNNHLEKCQDCIDIPLWPYTQEIKKAVKAGYFKIEVTPTVFIDISAFNYEQYSNYITLTLNNLITKNQPQLALLSTRLLL
ncbi:MAG: hypothetical protein ACE5EE_03290 [Fidelibacterota bacterium]